MIFLSLLSFEIQNRLRRFSTLIYFLVFFVIAFFLALKFSEGYLFINFSDKLPINSPVVIHSLTSIFGYFGLLIIAPIFGQSINQDFENGFYQFIFSTPIRKGTYFFSRFLASFISSISIFLSVGLGIWLATLMPFISHENILANQLRFYIAPYLLNIIPNTFIFGAIFIAAIAIFKKMKPVYGTCIFIYIALMLSGHLIKDLNSSLVAALVDPFGVTGANDVIKYWSIEQQTSQIVPLSGFFLYNRILWISIGAVALVGSFAIFNPFKLIKEKKRTKLTNSSVSSIDFYRMKCSLFPRSIKTLWELTLFEFRQAFSNTFCLVTFFLGALYIFFISGFIGKIYGTPTLPVTYQMLEFIGSSFSFFIIIITTYYAGELVWRNKDHYIYELVDSKTTSELFLYLSKLFSLFCVQTFLAVFILVACVFSQILKGYYDFEWSVYFQHLFLYNLPSWFLISVFALFAQTISKSKSAAHAVVIFYAVVFTFVLPKLDFKQLIYLIGELPYERYSDMNAYGTSFWPFIVFSLYWGFFHVILAIITVLFWRRGKDLTWKNRLVEVKARITPRHKILFSASFSLFIALGGFVYYNTNVLNVYKTKSAKIIQEVDYEINYGYFEKLPLPDLTDINVAIDIFPKTQSMDAKGVLTYRNNSDLPVKSVLLNISDAVKIESLTWNRPSTLASIDKRHGVQIYDFQTPIEPSDEVKLNFKLRVKPQGFSNQGFSKKILQNGTFFDNFSFFPSLGYVSTSLDNKYRKKHNLPEKPLMANINDKEAVKKTYIANLGSWIGFEAVISTAKDQIAIAPGDLLKRWDKGNRRYFHYKTNSPILPFVSFLSGRYEVAHDMWNDVKIEVYHHPKHTYNVPRIINSIKKSLDYYTENFSPYQFKQIRIVEFPRYGCSFAQSFPSTIAYSEGLGFIAKVDPNNPEDIDYPFYVTAHEVAHQWWAHQVIGANVQGATMLSESLAQYSALMVLEKEYGKEQMKKFLKYELDQYLIRRNFEKNKELPLILNENQEYIHYKKGSLVFYALKDYLGEATINKVLKQYIRDVAFQKPPFTRSIELVERFKQVTPIDKQYLIEDLFETITLYENRTDNVSFKKTPYGKFQVKIQTTNKKVRVNDLGKEEEISMNDPLDIGIYDKNKKLLYLEKHKLKSGQNTILIEVDQEPHSAGIDPLNKLIDKTYSERVKKIKQSYEVEK